MPQLGSLWVEQTRLHIFAEDGYEWYYEGEVVSTPAGAKLGSLWIEGTYLHYIDTNGTERRISSATMGSVTGKIGSLWNNGKFLYWVTESGYKAYGHTDITHLDEEATSGSHSDGYTNPHGDQPAPYYNYPDYTAERGHEDGYGTYTNSAPSGYNNSTTYGSPHSDRQYGDYPKRL